MHRIPYKLCFKRFWRAERTNKWRALFVDFLCGSAYGGCPITWFARPLLLISGLWCSIHFRPFPNICFPSTPNLLLRPTASAVCFKSGCAMIRPICSCASFACIHPLGFHSKQQSFSASGAIICFRLLALAWMQNITSFQDLELHFLVFKE